MRRLSSLLNILVVIAAFFALPDAVYAIPPLPSSQYGTVKINGENFAEGTLIQAMINGQVMAESQTLMYQGGSVYTIDIPGDDPDTKIKDGGIEGDTIQFKVGGLLAQESGLWRGGTNIEMPLTVSSSVEPDKPQPTRTPLPTQTPLSVSPKSASTDGTLSPSTNEANPSLAETETIDIAKQTENMANVDTLSDAMGNTLGDAANQNDMVVSENDLAADEVSDTEHNTSYISQPWKWLLITVVAMAVLVGGYWIVTKKRNLK